MSPQGYKNMDLESQDPIFNANLGQDKNLIWTKKLRCSHSIKDMIDSLCCVMIIFDKKREIQTPEFDKRTPIGGDTIGLS